MRALENFLARVLSEDVGKLVLRLTLGVLMLLHGISKFEKGINGIKFLVTKNGLPEFLAYGVYVGEIVAPILIIIGLYTRVSSLIYGLTMVFAIYLAHANDIFAINAKTGGSVIELQLLFMFGAFALMFLGAGKISADKN